eukprot:CAMPEP_0194286742 /NCGR_PEP_ID=MMETSP0169-20130528/33187_1 /TAXON_ID=218684 /ORGANISM="Corethron pennatum, Strain L29A3" /LENGTH=182 /DNA_ID=CAMNT_0039033255 /DNA_START=142 /DNA_END=690 /DNA_ORIENTATION=-
MMNEMQTIRSSPAPSPTESPDPKVLLDLQVLSDKISLCNQILSNTQPDSVNNDEALLGVIGFLEACSPRMLDLIDAGTQGVLAEASFEKCLEVNDSLLRTLAECDNPNRMIEPLTEAHAAAPHVSDLDDLMFIPESAKNRSPLLVSKKAATSDLPDMKKPAADFDTDFDDFLLERKGSRKDD